MLRSGAFGADVPFQRIRVDLQPSADTDGDGYVEAWAGYYGGADLQDCSTPGSSVLCGQYDRNAAAEYANLYALDRTPPGYHYFDGGDCTNFVSQALRKGGLRFHSEYEGEGARGAWWYLSNGTPTHSGQKNTDVWSVAEDLVDHLTGKGFGRMLPRAPRRKAFRIRAQKGDVFAFNWIGRENRFDHLAIVTGKTASGEPLLAYHTREQQNLPWSEMYDRLTSPKIDADGDGQVDDDNPSFEGEYGAGWMLDRIRITRTRANG